MNREDGWYHVFSRGLNRMRIFGDDRDREHLLELLEATVEQYRVEVHAYAWMDTHWHLVLRTPDGNLSRAMQWLNLSYAAWFNTRWQRKGPVFQRPFGSVPVQDGAWAYELSLYVHLNPLRIKGLGLSAVERKAANQGMRPPPSAEEVAQRLKKLREYRWSSYRAYAGYVGAPDWLTTAEVWGRAARKRSERAAAYRRDAQERSAEGGDLSKLEALRDSVAIGGVEFVREVKDFAAHIGLGRETGSKRALRKRVTMDEVIRAVEQAKGEDREEFGSRHGDTGMALVMWVARRCTGLTLREIGEAAGGRDYAAAGMAIRRLERRLAKDGPLRQQLQRVSDLLHVKMSPQ